MSSLEGLRTVVLSLGGPIFAVLDGAQFANLPSTLLKSDLRHRCLYLDRGDNHPERLVTAPYLVWLEEPQEVGPLSRPAELERGVDRLFAVLETGRSVAFWRSDENGERLYKHLRGLNRVLVPRGTLDEGETLLPNPEAARPHDAKPNAGETYEAVLFRHPDANVLMQVIPALDVSQLSRLLGPADFLVFMPDDESAKGGDRRVKRLQRQDDWPKASPGMLRIELPQYEAMRHARLDRSRRRLMSYLRECAPDETKGLDDKQLYQQVLVAEQSGRGLGIRSEAAHGQWAFLMLTTGGQIQEGEMVRRAVGNSRDPDRAVTELMREMVRQSRADLPVQQQVRR